MTAAEKRSLAGIIFDMDGTLFDTERVCYLAWREAGEPFGLPPEETYFHQFIGRNNVATRQIMRSQLGAGFPLDDFFAAVNKAFTRRLAEGVPLKPGVRELIAWLEQTGLPIGLATSSRYANAVDKLARSGLASSFAAIVTGDQVAASKPAPDIFAEAARRLRVPVEHCAALEDSPHGVASAHAAGCAVIMVPDLIPPTDDERARTTAIVADLNAAQKLLSVWQREGLPPPVPAVAEG